jgi:hypothetical protein
VHVRSRDSIGHVAPRSRDSVGHVAHGSRTGHVARGGWGLGLGFRPSNLCRQAKALRRRCAVRDSSWCPRHKPCRQGFEASIRASKSADTRDKQWLRGSYAALRRQYGVAIRCAPRSWAPRSWALILLLLLSATSASDTCLVLEADTTRVPLALQAPA